MIDLRAVERRLEALQTAIDEGVTPLETLEAEHAAIGRLLDPVGHAMTDLQALDQRIARGIADGSVVMPKGEKR